MHYRIDIDVKELNIAELNECLKENTKAMHYWERRYNKFLACESDYNKAGKIFWTVMDSLTAHRTKIKQEIFNNQKQQ